jgi:hypothetical protein
MGKKSKWQEIKEFFGNPTWNNAENIVDDPVDDIKHKLHGLTIFGWTFYLPSWLMGGSGKDDK